MSAEQMQHVALPMLYGAPAYARPTIVVAAVERPFDPDALPLQSVMTDEERELLARGPVRAESPVEDAGGRINPRVFSLQALTDRLRDLTG
jgi:hypothetical protein